MAGAVGVGVGVVLLLVALIFFFLLRSRRRLSYEELPIMANKEDERGGSCDTQHDPNMAPKPLPPPSLLSDRSSRASAVQRSRLELRKLEVLRLPAERWDEQQLADALTALPQLTALDECTHADIRKARDDVKQQCDILSNARQPIAAAPLSRK
jgi:hypothetical protein